MNVKLVLFRSWRGAALAVLAAALTFLPPAVAAQAAGTPLPALWGMHMVNRSTGWAVTKTELLRTTDGGLIWQDLTPAGTGGGPIEDAASVNSPSYGGTPPNLAVRGPKAAWLVVPATNALTVYRTTDGGAVWNSATLAVDASGQEPLLMGVDFVDIHHGWLAVNLSGVAAGSMDIEIYATTDDGATWHLKSGAAVFADGHGHTPLGGLKSGFAFATARRGFIAGQSYANAVWLYVSKDAGKSWRARGLAAPAGSTLERMLTTYPITLPPSFVTHYKGFLPVYGPKSAASSPSFLADFYATTNGGSTWRPTTPLGTTSFGPRFWGWPDARHGFVAGRAAMRLTSNAGLTWRKRVVPAKLQGVRQIDFGAASTGWAIVHDKLFKTTNRGRTWTALAASVTGP